MTTVAPLRPAPELAADGHLALKPEARWADCPDGVVVLNIASGRYFALSPVGSVVWQEIAAGASPAEIHRRLADRFPEAGDRLGPDLERLLAGLRAAGLLAPAGEIGRGPAPPDPSLLITAPPVPETATPSRPGRGSLPLAFGTLLFIDLLLRLRGFEHFFRLVQQRPVRRVRRPADIAACCTVVDRAARLYFKRAWCLQRSAATVLLLRRLGVPAHLVLGARAVPFLAHAWVEVDGRVVNDRATVQKFYREIARC